MRQTAVVLAGLVLMLGLADTGADGAPRRELAQAPSQLCAGHLTPGNLVETYLKAAQSQDRQYLRKTMFEIYSYLTCIDARSFARLHATFATYLETERNQTASNAELLAPLALVFFDVGGLAVDASVLGWLKKYSDLLTAKSQDGKSALNAIGTYAGFDELLVELSTRDAGLLFDSFDTPVWDSGQCSIRKMVALDGERLFCPSDCLSEALADLDQDKPEGALTGPFKGFVSDELRKLCGDVKNKLGDMAKSRKGIAACLSQYAARSDTSGFACLYSKFKDRRNPLNIFSYTGGGVEVRFPKGCWLSDVPPEEADRLRQLDEEERKLKEEEKGWEAANKRVAAVEQGRDTRPQPVGQEKRMNACEATAEGCSAPVKLDPITVSEARARVDAGTGRNTNGQREVRAERERILEQARHRNGPVGRCSPDSPDCGDSCGIENDRAQDAAECVQAMTPATPMSPRGPEPDPSPVGPDPLPAALQGLAACMAEVAKEAEPAGQEDCSACLRCANGEIPKGQNCTCTAEQRARQVETRCTWTVQCAPDAGSCECTDGPSQSFTGSTSRSPLPPDPEVFMSVRSGSCG